MYGNLGFLILSLDIEQREHKISLSFQSLCWAFQTLGKFYLQAKKAIPKPQLFNLNSLAKEKEKRKKEKGKYVKMKWPFQKLES